MDPGARIRGSTHRIIADAANGYRSRGEEAFAHEHIGHAHLDIHIVGDQCLVQLLLRERANGYRCIL